MIPAIVLTLGEHALNVRLFSVRTHTSQPEASQEKSTGLSNRGDTVQGLGYVGDGRAKKLKQRWDTPEISNNSFALMAGRIIRLGVVTRVQKPGCDPHNLELQWNFYWKQSR